MRRRSMILVLVGLAIGLTGWVVWIALRPAIPIARTPESQPPAPSSPGAEDPDAPRRDRAAPSPTRSRAEVAEARARRAEVERRIRERQVEREAAADKARDTGGELPMAAQAIDKAYIEARMTALRPLLKECYSLAAVSQPDLAGRLIASFVIAGEPGIGGIVEKATITHDDPDGGATTVLDECLQATIESMVFPPPNGGGLVSVSVPLVFSGKPKSSANASKPVP